MLLNRRTLLGAALAAPLSGTVRAAPVAVPTVDRLSLTILADGTVLSFAPPIERPGLRILPPPRPVSHQQTLRAEFGYAVLVEAESAGMHRRILVDFGYTPETLTANMALLGVDPASIDALVLSHGHYDHFGGMPALFGRVRRGTPLYVGGEEAFCARLRGTVPGSPGFGAIDRAGLLDAGFDLQIAADPRIVADAGFTTGSIPFASAERPKVPSAMLPGEGCRRDLLDPDRRGQDLFVDDAKHELGTAFNLRGKGLVVIGSCSHRGIVNTVLAAQAVSGVARVHGVAGGFHLVAPQTAEQALETLALLRGFEPAFLFPGHCTGEAFIAPAIAQLPDQVFRTYVGNRIELT
jgi:7,8-dihydropterin-6-yl-methyl-4-(beta-D-ribofuranosyl)aminobenzene 5'-phosphate synthase